MQYLNELYINADLARLICWGREGYEYAVTEDGHLTFPEGVTSDTTGFLHNVNWEMPNQFIAGVWEGNELDLWDQMQAFNQSALKSKAMGFTFNNSELTTEYTALANIYAEYQRQLEFGFLDPAVGIPEMVERMNKAGLEKYIAAKQEQIDQWAVSAGVQ
jgi:putative aldouronate transport system substrate-binding protein